MDLGLSRDEIALQARARAFSHTVARPRAAAIDRDEQYPWDIVKALSEAGFVGMTIPAALGGQGRSFLDAVLVIEEMAKSCTVPRASSSRPIWARSRRHGLWQRGQKKLAARLVLAGDKPAICHHRPDAGSDALAMTTRADRRGDVYVIDGRDLDHRRRRLRLHLSSARVRRTRRGTRHRRLPRRARRGQGTAHGAAEQTMGLRGMPEGELVSRISKCRQAWPCCRLPGCAAALPT